MENINKGRKFIGKARKSVLDIGHLLAPVPGLTNS